MGEVTTIGLDIAKQVFHVHGAAPSGAAMFSRRITRAKLLGFLSVALGTIGIFLPPSDGSADDPYRFVLCSKQPGARAQDRRASGPETALRRMAGAGGDQPQGKDRCGLRLHSERSARDPASALPGNAATGRGGADRRRMDTDPADGIAATQTERRATRW